MATKDFIEYSPTSGNGNGTINVTASKNINATTRSSNLQISGGITKSIPISQAGNEVATPFIMQDSTHLLTGMYYSSSDRVILTDFKEKSSQISKYCMEMSVITSNGFTDTDLCYFLTNMGYMILNTQEGNMHIESVSNYKLKFDLIMHDEILLHLFYPIILENDIQFVWNKGSFLINQNPNLDPY